jgi:hypothetical protein
MLSAAVHRANKSHNSYTNSSAFKQHSKSKDNISAGAKEVYEFLHLLGQEEYADVFLKANISSLQQIIHTSDATLEQLGLPLGPKKKISTELHRIRMKEILAGE